MRYSNHAIGVILVIIATLLLSFRSILVKWAYIEQVSVMGLFYYRFLFTVPLLLMVSFYKKGRLLFTTIATGPIFIGCFSAGFFGYYLATFFDFHSLYLIDASVNRLIVYTFPMYVLIIHSMIKKKRPSVRDILVFVLVQIGLFFVLGGRYMFFASIDRWGVLFAWIAAMSYAIYIVINQEVANKIGSILFTTYAVTCSFILINIHFFSVPHLGTGMVTLSVKAYLIILVMAIFCTFLPLLLISEGIKRIGAPTFSLISSTGPIMTICFAVMFLSETMTIQQIMGAVLVIGMLYVSEKWFIQGSH